MKCQHERVSRSAKEIFQPKKKFAEKALIPLPPTGFASLFCAKAGGGANQGRAQARCGDCEVFCNFTECKVLQRNAAAMRIAQNKPGLWQISRGPGLQGNVA